MRDRNRDLIEDLLRNAGIRLNGADPWDMEVHDDRLFRRIVAQRDLGLGESYMEGWWDAPALDAFFSRILRAGLDTRLRITPALLFRHALARLGNRQSRRRAFVVGRKHYDLGNDLFQQMLDRRMNYSCAYWKDAATLDEAQERKLDLVCRKLALAPGMHVLDIGCGWGAFGRYAAERYGVHVTGITVSQNQVDLGRTLCSGLPVEFRLQDYRDVTGSFDRIVSIGMFEHVGHRNYRTFFSVAHRCLADDGLFLLHTIGGNRSSVSVNAWTDRYIFPNGMLPSLAQVGSATEGLFVMEDWQSMGPDYDRTLMAWHRNVVAAWPELQPRYDSRFFRMWAYYLLSCAGAFRARRIQVWQMVLSKRGVSGGYMPVR